MTQSTTWMRSKRLRCSTAFVLAIFAAAPVGLASTGGAGAAIPASRCRLSSATGLRTIPLYNQGQSRPFLLYVPRGYSGTSRIPVVFDLHGSGGSGQSQLDLTQIEPVADAHGFAVLAPNGAVRIGGGYYWNVPGVPLVNGSPVPAGTPSDEHYLVQVLDKTLRTICIDQRRVYFTGFSGGARMTSTMACDYSRIFAGAAPVAGLRAGTPIKQSGSWAPDPSTCQPQFPIPILTFHGTADGTNPFPGNDDQRWGYSVTAALQQWAVLDKCSGQPTSTTVTSTTTLIAYTHCAAGSSVSIYQSAGASHSWPGTAGADDTINATALIWQFFSSHHR